MSLSAQEREELETVLSVLQQNAERYSLRGEHMAAGFLLLGYQTIRALATKIPNAE